MRNPSYKIKYAPLSTRSYFNNLSKRTFGRLKVLGYAGKSAWWVKCKCGIIKTVTSGRLIDGCTRSCGCFNSKASSKRRLKHGKSSNLLYVTWQNMISRCYNKEAKNYPNYGKRGIKVCFRWKHPIRGFKRFLKDMGSKPTPKHSLDRINNNGNYEPNNCRWATSKQQCNNTRWNKIIKWKNKSYTLARLIRKLNKKGWSLKYWEVHRRLQKGLTITDAIKTPIIRRNRTKPRN